MNCAEKHVLFGLWVLSIPSVVCPFQYCSQSRQCVRRLECRELPLTCLVLDGVNLVEKSNHEINNKHMTHIDIDSYSIQKSRRTTMVRFFLVRVVECMVTEGLLYNTYCLFLCHSISPKTFFHLICLP